MSVEFEHCGAERIERFLRSELEVAEATAVEQHVEICDSCRRRLHESAADEGWWADVSEFLTTDEHDEAMCESDAGLGDQSTCLVPRSGEPERHFVTEPALQTDVRQVVAWLAPTDDPAMLGRIGTYEIAGVIGSGGMGVVLKGFDPALNRYVAIKILAPHLATSGAARQRFAREAQAAAAVVHDNVVAIHGVDEANGLPYLVMPYLRGTSLQRRVDQHGPLNVSEVLRISLQTARGLAAAHDQGLVHRDIKPANILMDGTTERVLLTDFGLARAADDASLTHSGVIAGTPYFMSPEQAQGAAIDHRSDLFSLGSVMYTMCTGRPPFRAETSWGILQKVSAGDVVDIREVNSDIPPWLAGIIRKLHERQPSQRFQSATELAELLEQCLAHVQRPTQHPLPQAARGLSTTRSAVLKWSLNAALAVITTIVLVTIYNWSGSSRDVAADSTASSATGTSDSGLPSWDATATEVEDLRQSIEQLDQQMDGFWR